MPVMVWSALLARWPGCCPVLPTCLFSPAVSAGCQGNSYPEEALCGWPFPVRAAQSL